MLLFSSILPMIGADRENLVPYQSAVLLWLVASGAGIAWFGRKWLLDAEEILGRPLRWWEWLFDSTFLAPRPFHSFCFIQLPWWAALFAAAAFYAGRLMIADASSATP